MRIGQLVAITRRSTFKIGIVVGASRSAGKLRVCVWSDNSGCWSNPQVYDPYYLGAAAAAATTARRRAIVRRAIQQVARTDGFVAGVNVGRAFV